MGWIIAGAILAALAAILLIPLSAEALWDGELRVELKWLFWRKTVYPPAKKEEKTEKAQGEPEKQGEKAAPKKKRKQSIEEMLDNVQDYIKRCCGGVKMILRDLRVSRLAINWTVAGDDAAECAIRYGKINAYLHGALATLDNFVRIKKADIALTPDYTAEEESFTAEAVFSVTPLIVLIGAVRAGWGFLMKAVSDANKAKGKRSGKNERKKSRRTDGCVAGEP